MRKIPVVTRNARPVQEVCQLEDPIVLHFLQDLEPRLGLQESSEQGNKFRAILIWRHHVIQD